MKKIFILSVLLPKLLFSQNTFTLIGKANMGDSFRVVLMPVIDSNLYSIKVENDTTKIFTNEFEIKGFLQYPQLFRLLFIQKKRESYSDMFFLDQGIQKIKIETTAKVSDGGMKILMEGSATNQEYLKKYMPMFDSVNKRIDKWRYRNCDTGSLDEQKLCLFQSDLEKTDIRQMRDSIFYNYTCKFPESKIIPWLLLYSLYKHGYYSINYQKSFDNIKGFTSPIFTNIINDELVKQKKKSAGTIFPLVNFIKNNIPKSFALNCKYTLVDFWFSNCSPCIYQFNILRSIYAKYKDKGFDIVAISTDSQENISEYKKLLQTNNYPWKQLLDIDGTKASLLDIHKFPTNFLLDRDGKIIRVDIEPEVLDFFLQKKL